MKKTLFLLFFLSGCISNFGNHAHHFLKTQNEASLSAIIIKNQTTRAQIEQQFGVLPTYQPCYEYYETHLPFYNFLPTNMLYMKSVRSSWKLCIQYHANDIVQDYHFEHQSIEDVNSPIVDTLEIFKSTK